MKPERKLAVSSVTCLLWRHKVCREHFVCFVSPERYYFRGDRTKAIRKFFSSSFSISWSISHKKNFILLYKPFFSFFIIQVLENSDFSYLSLHDRLWLFRPITIERGKFLLISIGTRRVVLHHAADSYMGSRCFYQSIQYTLENSTFSRK